MIPSFASSVCDAVGGNLIQNCGFETGNLNSWTVTRATTGSDLGIGATGSNPGPHSGSYDVFFGATGGLNDTISETLASVNSASYQVSFWLMNTSNGTSSNESFTVYWDGAQIFSGSTSAFSYTQYSFTETGAGNDVLRFSGLNAPGGYGLDDVVVTGPMASAVPEPASIMLFGTVLLGVGYLFRRTAKVRRELRARA